jgi:flagellar motor component MotA
MLLIFGFLFMVFIFAIVGIVSQFFHTLINLPSALLILVPLIFFLFASKSGNVFGRYIKMRKKKGHLYSEAELTALSIAIKNTIKFTIAVGGFCFIVFGIICLGYLGSPERLGPNLAICLTSLTYSIAVSYFVFFPTQAWAENKIKTL